MSSQFADFNRFYHRRHWIILSYVDRGTTRNIFSGNDTTFFTDDVSIPSALEIQPMKINSTLPPTASVDIYRPLPSSGVVFLDELAELISIMSADSNVRVLLCGDVNLAGTNGCNIVDNFKSVFDSF